MPEAGLRVAVVEDDPVSGQRLAECLQDLGQTVEVFQSGEAFLERFIPSPHDFVVSDLKMPGLDGLEVLRRVKARRAETEVVVVTGYASLDTAIEAIRHGAFHYLTKPIRQEEFQNLARRVIEKISLQNEARNLRASLLRGAGLEGMVGSSPEMAAVFRLVEKVSPLDCPVLIQGASGTGKELVARAIHRLSGRRAGPFVCFNCGGFTPELIANELFGHEKGSYTGAVSARRGLLEAADRGTVVLDEIGEMPPEMQVKLLRVLQEKQIFRLGGNAPISLDLRVLSLTNKNLAEEVRLGRFREDLYFRINVVTVVLPPLAARSGDLPLLMDHFLHQFNQAFRKKLSGFTPEAKAALERYGFPGNVRELENIVARAAALSEGPRISLPDLPPVLQIRPGDGPERLKTLEEVEKEHIQEVLKRAGQIRSDAARILGVTRTTLWRKLKKYGLVR